MKKNGFLRMVKRIGLLAGSVIMGFSLSEASAGNLTWSTTSGVWNTSTPNWTGDSTTFTDGDNVTFNTPAAASGVNIAAPVAPASIRINTTSTANYFTFTNADITGSAGLTQGGGGTVQFTSRKQWSFGGGVASSNGLIVLDPPTLANNDLCHLGTNTIRLSGTSLTTHGKFRYTPNTTASGTGVDQDLAISGFGTLQTHQSGNINAALAFGKTLTLEGGGATLLLLEDYAGGGNGGYMVIASNGTIRLAGGASDTREIRLSSFSGNASGFQLAGVLAPDAGFTNALVLRNMTGKALRLTGNYVAYSNGFVVAGAPGKVAFGSSAAMGATDAGSAKIRAEYGGYLSLAFAFSAGDLARIDGASEGILGIDANTSVAIDLSASGLNAPNLFVGGDATAVYTGILTPYGSVYRFGGTGSLPSSPNIGTLIVGTGAAATDNLLTGNRSLMVSVNPSNSSSFRLLLQNNNDYTGGSIVKARALLAIGRTGGTPVGSGRVVIEKDGGLCACGTNGSFYSGTAQFTNYLAYAGVRFLLDETLGGGTTLYGGGSGQGRWGDSAPVALNGGYLGLGAPKNNLTYETIGAIGFEQDGQVRWWDAGGTARYFLTADSLARVGRGLLRVVNIDGAGAVTIGGAYRLRLATPPEQVNGMLPPSIYDTGNRTFYTYNTNTDAFGAVGLTNLVYSLSGATVLNGALASTDTVNQTSDLTLNNSPTVHALKTAQLVGSSYTVTILSGGLIFSANNKTHTANFSFGNAEGIAWADAGSQTLNGTLTGTNGLTKGGASTVALGANNSGTLKGPVTVNQGVLQLNHANTLGQTNDLFVGLNATLNVNAQTNLQVGNLGGHGTIQLNTRFLRVFGNLNPGSSGSLGTQTISQAGTNVFESGATMTFDLGALARASDQLVVSSAAVALNNNAVTINNADGMEAGIYTLIDTQGGAMSGTPGPVTMPSGFNGSLAIVSNDLVLTVTAGSRKGALIIVR